MIFKNPQQRKAAFRRMKGEPSIQQVNSKSGLDSLNKDLFGFDQNTSALTKRMGKSGAFDHLSKKKLRI